MIFCVWLLSLNLVCEVHLCYSIYHYFIPFEDWKRFHFIYILRFVYLSMLWWEFGLLLPFGYCKLCCYEHARMCICLSTCSQFPGEDTRNKSVGAYGNSMFNFLRNFQTVFQRVKLSWRYLRDVRAGKGLSPGRGEHVSPHSWRCQRLGTFSECRILGCFVLFGTFHA